MDYAILFITIMTVVLHKCLAADVDCKKHPARVNPKTCCNIFDLISDELKEYCKKSMMPPSPISGDMRKAVGSENQQNGSSPHRKYHGPHMSSCFMSCFLNKTGIVNVTVGELNEEKLSAYLKVVVKNDTNLISVVEKSFKTCFDEAEKFHAKMLEKIQNRPASTIKSTSINVSQDRMLSPARCSPFAGQLMGCVGMESIINCPSSVWSNTKECNDMRDHMKQCKY